jgi:ATP-dependent DNA ligase
MKYNILKAVEFDACSAKFRKEHGNVQALVEKGWWVQPKYDGCFGKVYISENLRECYMVSRTDEPVRSCDHLIEALWKKHTYARAAFPAVYLGEVWARGEPFPKISGAFRQHSPAPWLEFVVNDMIYGDMNCRFMTSGDSYAHRYNAAWGVCVVLPELAEVTIAISHSGPKLRDFDVARYALSLKEQGGYDGAILRNPVAPYAPVVAKDGQIVKVKPSLSLDLEVAATHAEQRDTKLGGHLTVLHRAGGPNGAMISTNVGSGVTQAMCGEIMSVAGAFISQIAEIEFMGYTEDGHLREPRFKGWRHDKLSPDV